MRCDIRIYFIILLVWRYFILEMREVLNMIIVKLKYISENNFYLINPILICWVSSNISSQRYIKVQPVLLTVKSQFLAHWGKGKSPWTTLSDSKNPSINGYIFNAGSSSLILNSSGDELVEIIFVFTLFVMYRQFI